jgi:RHS repeat-associated protein
MKDRTVAMSVTLALVFGLFLIPSASDLQGKTAFGASATLLPDGRWLLLGGQGAQGALSAATIWDPQTQSSTPLSRHLQQARAWHSATVLPDSTVLIFGGVDGNGQAVGSAELFDPATQTFRTLPPTGLTPRASHTATLLTDGHVLIVGGVGTNGQMLGGAQLWDPQSHAGESISAGLTTARHRHSATLLPDGTVVLWGGTDHAGAVLNDGEIYDPILQRFTSVGALLPAADPASDPPQLEVAVPSDGATDVPGTGRIVLRFSKPLRVETLTSDAVTLSGPQGPEAVTITPAEGGRLAFITPQTPLSPGTTYTLALSGATDLTGLSLPFTTLRFTTRPATGQDSPADSRSGPPGSPGQPVAPAPPDSPGTGPEMLSADAETWVPTATHRGGNWRSGRPDSPWRALPPLQAAAGVTALAGQALTLNGEPLANVTLEIEGGYGTGTRARTDSTGRFLVTHIAAGRHELLIDGRSASRPGRTYGVFEAGVTITQGQTNALSYTIWMPRIDTAHAVTIPSPTSRETVITTPHIPGLEVRIPAGTVIRDHEGQVVRQISITPIPVDRPPFPLPANVEVPIYFTIQPGGAYVINDKAGVRLVYPNYTDEMPGTRANFWHYDPEEKGWHIYGQGTVTDDGTHVMPDPGVEIYEFTGAMINVQGYTPPPNGPPPGSNASDGDPVDLFTGLFVLRKTDLVVQDVLPIVLTRTYRQGDTISRAFGIGATHPYDLYLWSAQQYQQADLILPDGGRIHYVRISPGIGFAEAVFEHKETPTTTATPTAFYKSVIRWNGDGWDLTLKDGTVFVFGDEAPLQSIRDRYGNTIRATRAGVNNLGSPVGNITKITSPNGRWIEFTYDASNRITQAKDQIGRIVSYAYDNDGRLTSVTDPAGGVTKHTYQKSRTSAFVRTRMLTITDPRGTKYLTNAYDGIGRVTQQTLANGATYRFTYGANQTDVTDPRGIVRRVTFNSDGYALTDTRAVGTPEQQTTGYERQVGSNLVLAVTDALGRRTAYTYDALGNIATVTRLAGTPGAVMTTFAYEPTFSRLASFTDPLNHTTTLSYDSEGNLTTVIDPLGNPTNMAYNAAGQPLSITDPIGNATRFEYDAGDLVATIDPIGNRTTRFLDAAGRLVSLTDPLGRRTRYDYDALDRLTRVTDPLGGMSVFAYDSNGNLLSVTDARGSVTSHTYDSMDRLANRRDPLLRMESYQYDAAGNLTKVTDRKGQVTTFAYDGLNRNTFVGFGTRVRGQTTAYESTITYTYDAGNRLTRVVDSLSGTITRTWDDLSRPSQETTPQGTVSYTYDAAGRRATMTVLGQPTVSYSYDSADRLTQTTQGTSTVSFTYDTANRRLSLTLPNGVVTEYAYDAASRLIGLSYKNGPTVLGTLTYTYDPTGNRVQIGGAWARTGLPQPVGAATYNAANQQVTFGAQAEIFDLNGNLTNDGTSTYTWDARNRLVSMSGPGLTASFQYDSLGRRTRKTINGTATDYHYDGLNPVQELNGAAVVANLLAGLGVDEYFTRADATSTRNFLPDALASTMAELDSSLGIQAEHTYEPFGATSTTGATGNTFLYTGRESDGTGLYYYRARFYSPGLQRFISEDPIGLAGGFHPYLYADNNPILNRDPLGLFAPAHHAHITQTVAYSECRNLASSLPNRVYLVDFQEGSQLPENAYKHAMRDGILGQSPADAARKMQEYIDSELGKCSAQAFANALHAEQDRFAPGHRGFHPWYGQRWPSFTHIFGDTFGALGGPFGRAVAASRSLMQRFKATCPCVCR